MSSTTSILSEADKFEIDWLLWQRLIYIAAILKEALGYLDRSID